MNMKAPHHILLAILGIVALVLSGCGGNEEAAKDLGCPSGSILANSDDQIVVVTAEPSVLYFWAGPSIPFVLPDPMGNPAYYTFPYSGNYGAIVVKVQGPFNTVRNDICVVLNTDGFFWDKDFTAPKGTLSLNGTRYVTKTDVDGQITLWWSTGLVVSSTTASGTTNGTDVSYNDSVTASSGPAPQGVWNAAYSVKGCPPSTICP